MQFPADLPPYFDGQDETLLREWYQPYFGPEKFDERGLPVIPDHVLNGRQTPPLPLIEISSTKLNQYTDQIISRKGST